MSKNYFVTMIREYLTFVSHLFLRFDPGRLYDLRSPIGGCPEGKPGLGGRDNVNLRDDSIEDLSNGAVCSSEDCDESDSNSSRSGVETLSRRFKSESHNNGDDSENDPSFLLADTPPLMARRTR